jgi:hypothetical protein
MPRSTTFDGITYQLLQQYVLVLKPLSGLGQVGGTGAVYGHLGLPMPQEPFPCIYNYIGGIRPDYSQGKPVRRDVYTIISRILGGPITPTYKVNPEDAVNSLITAVLNELDYRPYLQDPAASDAPFRYIDPGGQVQVVSVGRTQAFGYSDQGAYVGIEITSSVTLILNMGRVS